jgi:hypothetical protein
MGVGYTLTSTYTGPPLAVDFFQWIHLLGHHLAQSDLIPLWFVSQTSQRIEPSPACPDTVRRCLSGLLLLCACYPVMSLDKVYPELAVGNLWRGMLRMTERFESYFISLYPTEGDECDVCTFQMI